MATWKSLNKRASGGQTGSDKSPNNTTTNSRWDSLNSSAAMISQKREQDRLRKEYEEQQKALEKARAAVEAQNAYKQRVANRAEESARLFGGNWIDKAKGIVPFVQAAGAGIKSFLGMNAAHDVLPVIENAPQEYKNIQEYQQYGQDYASNWAGRGSQVVIDAGKAVGQAGGVVGDVVMHPLNNQESSAKIAEATKGGIKNLGELASGTLKLIAKYNPTTSGLTKQPKIKAFIDNNGILNYHPDYTNKYQKVGAGITEIGTWFIPITRLGKVSALEEAIAGIPKIAKFLNTDRKLINIVKSGTHFAYEVGKDAVDIGTLDTLRGKKWDETKGDMVAGAAGGTVLRGLGAGITTWAEHSALSKIESGIGRSLTEDELKLTKNLLSVEKPQAIVDHFVAKDAAKEAADKAAYEAEKVASEVKVKPIVDVKSQDPSLLNDIQKNDYENILKHKIDAVPTPKKGEITVIKSGDGKWVDTQVDEALSRGVDVNTKVMNVKESELALTGNVEKDLRGERFYNPGQSIQEVGTKLQTHVGNTKSKMYERVKNQIDEEYRNDFSYNKMNMEKDAQAAVNFVEKDTERAMRIARGLEEAPAGQTETKISIALAEKAKMEGNHQLQADLILSRTLRQIKRGQEIVAEKGSVETNSASSYIKRVINERLQKINNTVLERAKRLSEQVTKKGKNSKIIEGGKKLGERIDKKKLDLISAQNLIDKLTCK